VNETQNYNVGGGVCVLQGEKKNLKRVFILLRSVLNIR
jgi:hypothetical protein